MTRRILLAGIILGLMPSTVKADITSDLVGWWKLDDGIGANAADLSGNGRDGTLQNGAETGS